MNDHYSILGVEKNATQAEIKVAYRRLVKLYHPDKNPNNPSAVEKFRLIQEAYDTLNDPEKRSGYDNRYSFSSYEYSYGEKTQQNRNKARTKKYTFTEEDLKRRQYYKEHYKQQTKTKTGPSKEQKKAYNEAKYILFSVPVSIALLFFIINIYNRESKEPVQKPVPNISAAIKDTTAIKEEAFVPAKTADQPYNYLFGEPKVDKQSMQVVEVTNWSSMDAVVCIVDSKTDKPIRNYYLASKFNILYEFLPEGTYYIRNYLGKNFRSEKKHEEHNINGIFLENRQFQSFPQDTFSISLNRHDTISVNIDYIKDETDKNLSDAKSFFGL